MRFTIRFALYIIVFISLCSCSSVNEGQELDIICTSVTENTTTDYIAPEYECASEPENQELVKSNTLGVSVESIVNLIHDVKPVDVEDIDSVETDDYIMYKAGLTSSGMVCFSNIDDDEISVVYFLSYSHANSSAFHRREAISCQKLLVSYFQENGIDVIYDKIEIDDTYVYSVAAEGSSLSYERLPITILEFRNKNYFLCDEERTNSFMSKFINCQYSEARSIIIDYLESDLSVTDDFIRTQIEYLDKLCDLSAQCTIEKQINTNNVLVKAADILEIDSNVCIVPSLQISKYGASFEANIGFLSDDWIFFDTIIIDANDNRKTIEMRYRDIEREVIRGGRISESCFTSSLSPEDFRIGEDCDRTICFYNSKTRDSFSHTLSEKEASALQMVSDICTYHNKIRSSISIWLNK